MAGATKTCRGIILTSREHKDKDRILKFLTRDEGLIDIYVKGSGKLNSHSAFTSVPYMLCDLTYTVSGNYNFLKSGAIVESNSRLMTDFDLMTAAAHCADVLLDMSGQSDNSVEAYEIAAYTFFYLAKDPDKRLLYLSAFNWRVLSVLGFTVEYKLTSDTALEVNDKGIYDLSTTGGDLYSGRKNGGEYQMLSGKAVLALNHIACCDLKDLYAISAGDDLSEALFDFTVSYLSNQLEKDYLGRFLL